MKRLILLLAAHVVCLDAIAAGRGDVRCSQQDIDTFEAVMATVSGDRGLPVGELVVRIARTFLGTPYVAGTLELEPERLTVNLSETDCIIFVETCIALAMAARDEVPSFDGFLDHLCSLRYRNGVVDGYASRLHYTSEWIAQGVRTGVFEEVTRECGGSPLNQSFNYMSTHPAAYRQLKDSPENVAKIRAAELSLEAQDYWYIPKSDLQRCVSGIHDGDVIAFCSSAAGLDIAHAGIALWEGGTLTFINASLTHKKVEVNPGSLVSYITPIKSQTGIRVIRLR